MNEKQQKAVVNRIARAMGHLEYVKRMVEDNREPSDILMQLSAVESAVHSTGLMMIEDQADECLATGDTDSVKALIKAMERYCK